MEELGDKEVKEEEEGVVLATIVKIIQLIDLLDEMVGTDIMDEEGEMVQTVIVEEKANIAL